MGARVTQGQEAERRVVDRLRAALPPDYRIFANVAWLEPTAREGDRNLFIAECKFWHGPKQLTATVDQILGYTSWRDTKTAIFVFNRRRDLSKVLQQIVPTVKTHPRFIREIPYGDETSFRFVLSHRDDAERELTLTILVFEIPG